ncbi:conserved exported hypothetical protein [Burkholderiales bacterium 8X]|nr:conserved exported hypothetical protein [Burkholderiales bacterium 8X]
MKRRMMAIACLAAGLVMIGSSAQAAEPCPANGRELPVEALFGSWEARIEGEPGLAQLRLARHPDYAGVSGSIERTADGQSRSARVAGDIDDEGLLSIDESDDGQRISGVWLGELRPESCGKEFRGVWRNALDDSTHSFTLNKIGNWK